MAESKPFDLIPVYDVKRFLRRLLVRRRQQINSKDRLRWSQRAVKNLINSSYYTRAKVIAAFIGFGSEIITDGLIAQCWKDGKKVLIPISSEGFGRPFFALFQKGDSLKKTPQGPFELIQKKNPFPFRSVDLVLVPGLGFDKRGHRLGYGGGVYDRILAKTPQAQHVGFYFSLQELTVIPMENHDKKMDAIVTEKGL
ncbi:MAG: putative protein YqgN [Elusimicrobia bacterium]|nr:putative protein YqgN [Elusimicrobiota bacterium]